MPSRLVDAARFAGSGGVASAVVVFLFHLPIGALKLSVLYSGA